MKKKKDNLKYISGKFAEENITAPDSLNEDNIVQLLESDKEVINIDVPKKRTFKGAKALVASLAVVVTALAVFGITKGAVKLKNEAQFNKNTSNGIVSFTSFSQINEYTKKYKDNDFYIIGKKSVEYEAVKKSDSMADGLTSSSAPASFAETYKQVEGVDEADIVKTDANYIYWLVDSEGKIVISSAQGLQTKKVSEIHLKDGVFASEMFLNGDTLVVTGTNFYSKDGSFVLVYDISDRSKPELKSSYSQSGNYTDARMIGECVYLISTNDSFYLPYCTTGAVRKQVDYADICAVKDSEYASYTLIGAFDTATGKSKSIKAVIGTSAQIYCSQNNLYLFSTINNDSLKVLKYELKGAKIALRASGNVKGQMNDQFSADEKNSFLRLATTYYGTSAEVNKLYVLDEGLKVVGSVSGFAKNEHIEAVKYIGDYAYVITYKTTDPLFIIDLTNPRAPQITGEVKIEGFSTLLYPVDDNTLLGIGYNTEPVEESFVEAERTDGVKIVLFDISDKNNPEILDQKIFEGAYSAAQENHKALVINKEKGYFAIPLENNFGDSDEGEILVFGEKSGKIDIKNEFTTPTTIERCTYIGDYIYGIDTYCENIYSFK